MDARVVLEHLDVGVVAIAPDWTIVEWSAPAARITGLATAAAWSGGSSSRWATRSRHASEEPRGLSSLHRSADPLVREGTQVARPKQVRPCGFECFSPWG